MRKGSIAVEERPKPSIGEATDVVRVVLTCVCGSDLWYYRGESDHPVGSIGHEFIGVVDEIGADVSTVQVGDFVIAPFAWSDGVCKNCEAGFHTACIHGGFFGGANRATAARPSSSACRKRTAPSWRFRAVTSRTRPWPPSSPSRTS
jgi:threonine dehydrogenase-like Zn-dependent dehydrogenase